MATSPRTARARRRLTRLEIEAHWIKAELARLESEIETDLATELLHEYRLDDAAPTGPLFGDDVVPRAALPERPTRFPKPSRTTSGGTATASNITAVSTTANGRSATVRPVPQRRRRRKSSPALLASFGVHALALLLLAPMTYVMLTSEPTPLFASMFESESPELDDPGTAPIELVSFEEFDVSDPAELTTPALAESIQEDFAPLPSELGGEMASDVGSLNSLPTDVGTLLAGGGASEGRGAAGGRRRTAGDEAQLGLTTFFGTQARANRVVFLVDNSGSMKQGRMETTLFELARSIEALGPKQEFYVVFYSDQAYPMFYPDSVMQPLAATRENKQRLYAWLQTVELCTGGALLKAVELAESLEPQVVYILSDGDITGTKTVERLTQPSGRRFAIHALGMGVKKPEDAQNLAAIAQANRGTFQMVRPLPAAVQMAKARPIRSNSFGVAWGTGPKRTTR